MAKTFHNSIGGLSVPARSGRTFLNLDPATGETLGKLPDSDVADVAAGAALVAHPRVDVNAVRRPRGGVLGTGNGHREAGHTMLDAFTEWKSITVDFGGKVQRAQIDNN